MLKKVAACLLVCASMATWVGCASTTSNKYLYAAIPASNEIVAYREDPNAGVLTQLVGSPITAGQAVESLALHPSKKFLYAANSGTNPFGTVSLFTISSSGGLTEVTPRANAGTSPTILAMDSAGSFLYVGNSGSQDISVFSIDASTGALTPVLQQNNAATQGLGLAPLNIKLSPSGNMLYVTGEVESQGYIEAFSLTAGVLTPINIYLTGNNPYGLTIDTAGSFLYTANTQDRSISEFTINSDGSLAPLPGSPNVQTEAAPVALLIDKSGKYMYVANDTSPGTLFAYSIGSDGSLSLIANSQFSTGAQPNFIAGDPSGKYLFVGNQSSPVIQSLSLNGSTGILTSVSSYSVPGTPSSIVVTP
jgi:6-phosphogluconolactonase (cycloisomerase 2 family)